MAKNLENNWKQEFDQQCHVVSLEAGHARIKVISDIWLGLREDAVTADMRNYADSKIKYLLMSGLSAI